MTIPLSGFFNSDKSFTKAWERNAQQSHTKEPCAVSSKNARRSKRNPLKPSFSIFMGIGLTCLTYPERGHGFYERDSVILNVLDKLILIG